MAAFRLSENNKMIYKYQIKRMETDYDTKGPGNAFKLRKYTAEGFLQIPGRFLRGQRA